MRSIALSTILFMSTLLCYGENGAKKYLYTKEKLSWLNPWLPHNNISGLILNDTFLKDSVSAYNNATLTLGYESGEFKNIFDPAVRYDGDINIESYLKLKNIYLYGDFGYNYLYGKGSRWRGLINPYETPFMLADSIPGNISNELYSMSAGIAIPTGKSSAFGIKASYDVSLFSKHKDLRNKNTLMNFSLTPGFIYNGNIFKGGVSVGYTHNTEKIEYLQIDDSQEKYIFDLFGVWLYHGTGYSGARTSRIKRVNSVSGSMQLDLSLGKFRLFNDFSVDYSFTEETETGYNNLRHGDTERLTYRNRFIAMFGLQHKIEANVMFYRMLGYRHLQRQELDPNSNIRIWVTYGSPINCYVRDYREYDANYTFRRAKSEFDISWEASAGVRGYSAAHTNKQHPFYFSQSLRKMEPYGRYTKYFNLGRSLIEINPELSYSFYLDGEIIKTSGLSSDNAGRQLIDELHEEYLFFSHDRINAGIRIRYGYNLNKAKGNGIHIEARYKISFKQSLTMRHFADISIGFTF